MKRQLKWGLVAALTVVAAGVLIATGILMSGVVLAGHTFTDVPTSAFYHNAVEWVFNRGITAGCAPSMYCPDANVTRGQMAVFLQKLGQAVTPITLTAGVAAGGALDPDANPVVCPTGDHTPAFPQRALFQSFLKSRSTMTNTSLLIYAIPVYSTDGGITWAPIPAPSGVYPSVVVSWVGVAGALAYPVSPFASLSLTQGTPYRFAVRVSRLAPTFSMIDIAEHECVVHVEILNRNPTTSPLAPKP